MKKFLLSLLIVFIFTATAKAEVTPYLALRGGWEYSNQTYHAHVPLPLPLPLPWINQNSSGGNLFSAEGATIGAAAGLKFNHSLRAELAYTRKSLSEKNYNSVYYPENDLELKVEQQTILINAFFYPFKEMKIINPFIGAGLGLGKSAEKHALAYEILNTETNFCFIYALYLGTDINVAKNFNFELFGTYNSMPAPKYTLNTYIPEYKNLNPSDNWGVNFGLRYSF